MEGSEGTSFSSAKGSKCFRGADPQEDRLDHIARGLTINPLSPSFALADLCSSLDQHLA